MRILWASITWLFHRIERTLDAVGIWLSLRNSVFYVHGRYLYDNNHEKVILRGINLMLADDWDFPGSDKLGELEKTGANAVRIQWYKQYPPPQDPNLKRPDYDIYDLDDFLEKCRVKSLIPILELHDWTRQDYTQSVNMELISWWTRPDVVAVLRRHERYLIINLANELGRYRFVAPADRPAALNNFKNNYKTAITSIRNQGLRMPIMIDAPDVGQSINAFTSNTSNKALLSIGKALITRLRDLALLREPTFARLEMPSNIGQELIAHDPRHNLLLSVHSYWAGYDGRPEIDAAVQTNLPIVFGEIANKQEGFSNPCYYDLDGPGQNHPENPGFRYQDLLKDYLKPKEIGWLGWGWDKDSCAARRMTPDGNYSVRADLTPYGDDIVFNPDYGLKPASLGGTSSDPAKKTKSLPGSPRLFPGQSLRP